MIIKFDFFFKNNFDNLNINIYNKDCYEVINFISNEYDQNLNFITIYEDNKLLSNSFLHWDITKKYFIIINAEYITIYVKVNNNKLKLPQLDINTKIIDIKNILSIKDDIFLNNIKLKDNSTLFSYNIKNNNILNVNYHADVVTDAVNS